MTAVQKEIGGYFEFEHLIDRPRYPDLEPLNLGRSALIALLGALGCTKLYLPGYLCDSMTDACADAGIEMVSCPLDGDLVTEAPLSLSASEYVLLVSYYGQLSDEKILKAKDKYKNIIVDHTQAFFQRPLPGIPTLYSVRKYFGVSDGAYISWYEDPAKTHEALLPFISENADESRDRFSHLLGRFECSASAFYQDMLRTADTYHGKAAMPMSKLTRNILGAIDYERAAAARNENYQVLKTLLPSSNDFTRITPEGPFAYPFRAENGIKIRQKLAAKKIFIPTYWKNVLNSFPEGSREYTYAADILPLPCDQRYNAEDMKYLASEVIKAQEELS